MKRKLFFISSFFICLSFFASDCNNDSSSVNNPHNSIGTISYTEDGGETWFTRNAVLAGDVTAICSFPSDMDTFCFVISYPYPDNQQIFKTTNSGENFISVYTSPKYISDITGMLTEGKGYAIGNEGFILITTNYGTNWTEVNTQTSSNLSGIDFGDESNGIIIGETNILTTSNGGTNWIIRPGIQDLNSISYISSFPGTEAVSCGKNGKIYRTVNNGENWNQVNSPVNESFVSIDFIDPVGIIGFAGSLALRSTDRGLSWYTVSVPSQGSFLKVYTEGSYYWLISVVNLLRSTDQGQTWANHWPSNLSLNDGMFQKNKGIVVGNRIGN